MVTDILFCILDIEKYRHVNSLKPVPLLTRKIEKPPSLVDRPASVASPEPLCSWTSTTPDPDADSAAQKCSQSNPRIKQKLRKHVI